MKMLEKIYKVMLDWAEAIQKYRKLHGVKGYY
jgi:hypothetical protein